MHPLIQPWSTLKLSPDQHQARTHKAGRMLNYFVLGDPTLAIRQEVLRHHIMGLFSTFKDLHPCVPRTPIEFQYLFQQAMDDPTIENHRKPHDGTIDRLWAIFLMLEQGVPKHQAVELTQWSLCHALKTRPTSKQLLITAVGTTPALFTTPGCMRGVTGQRHGIDARSSLGRKSSDPTIPKLARS